MGTEARVGWRGRHAGIRGYIGGAGAGLAGLLILTGAAGAGQDTETAGPRILSEIRLGALRHDAGVFVGRREPDGIDANLEFLFVSPDFLEILWSPRPHLGLTANSGGSTSQAYFGLTWDVDLFGGLFFEAGLGGSVHNGELETTAPERKSLGCRWLFRESIALGYRISERHNISVMADHVSNNDRCNRNAGLDTLGVRWGYRF